MKINEAHVAIRDVCAWPNLTQMPDGAIVATIFNQPCHGLWEGDVECWGSEDDGRTWCLRGTVAPHEPGTNRMNVAAGLVADGDLVVLAAGWSHRPAPGQSAPHTPPAHPLLPWVCRSADGGRTWMHTESIAPPEGHSAQIVPFGDIIRLGDNTLGVCTYGGWQSRGEDRSEASFYASADGGHTWQFRSVMREGGINEAAPLVLPDGLVLACARTDPDGKLELYRSADHGRTWDGPQAVSLPMQHPAHLLRLRDGQLLLSYGMRNPGYHGVAARLGSPHGTSWGQPLHLVKLDPAGDVGYPSSVQLEDDTIITAYYANHSPEHDGYHMGVARWRI